MLAGCGRHAGELQVEVPRPVAVTIKDTPSAELLRCPEPPAGFPRTDAVIAPDTRAAIIRLAKAYAMTVAQLERLIRWSKPGACGAEVK
ncbi:hypothetical protein HMP06_3013 [Sphingomonas sp. HMP6]|nr:hypothetical protein HMP06_3013 [Sphingomonas sp. HMP6]